MLLNPPSTAETVLQNTNKFGISSAIINIAKNLPCRALKAGNNATNSIHSRPCIAPSTSLELYKKSLQRC